MASQLVYNRWFGKALGFTGAVVLVPQEHLALGIIIGIGLGYVLDLWASRTWWQVLSPREAYLAYTFGAMGKVARRSGIVQPAHISAAEAHMRELDCTPWERKQAIEWFRQGKTQPDEHFKRLARGFPSTQLADLKLQLTKLTAIQPGDAAIQQAVTLAGFAGVAAAEVAATFQAELHTQGEARPKAEATGSAGGNRQRATGHTPNARAKPLSAPLRAAYRTLGLQGPTSYDQVTQAYRRLRSRYHPDKLGPKATPKRIKQAERQLREVRAAFELIGAHRKPSEG